MVSPHVLEKAMDYFMDLRTPKLTGTHLKAPDSSLIIAVETVRGLQ
jgi:hypothetical protein